MNSISWFIYFTNVADGLRVVIFLSAVFGVIALFFTGMASFFSCADSGDEFADSKWMKWFKRGVVVIPLAVLVGVAIPDRRTMVLIAGSEIGQRAIQSDEVQQVINPGMDLLKAWIKSETERLSDKNKKEENK